MITLTKEQYEAASATVDASERAFFADVLESLKPQTKPMQTLESIKHLSNSNGIKPRWVINHAIHGTSIIDPRSLRYYRNERHPYGWQVSFRCSLILPDGTRKPACFGALGTDRRAAMANALPR